MSSAADRWARIAGEAELNDDDMAALAPVLLDLEQTGQLTRVAISRVANRVWLEAHRPAAGSLKRRLADLLTLGRSQVKLFGLPFWLVSITVMVAGAGAEAVGLDPGRTLAFYLAAPLLAYTAALTAFRGQGYGPQELELATPVSPRELLLARLFLILLYDVVIGLVASLLVVLTWTSSLSSITLAWLSPLLLITGVTLVLTSWMPVERAGALTYGTWAIIVVGSARLALAPASAIVMLELGMLGLGALLVSLIVIALPGRFGAAPGRAAA